MHPASRMKALQQVQQASTGNRKTSTSSSSKSEWSGRIDKEYEVRGEAQLIAVLSSDTRSLSEFGE